MDPTVWTRLAEQGGMTVIAVALLLWLLGVLVKKLEKIEKAQTRSIQLLAKLLREFGVSYREDD